MSRHLSLCLSHQHRAQPAPFGAALSALTRVRALREVSGCVPSALSANERKAVSPQTHRTQGPRSPVLKWSPQRLLGAFINLVL